MPQRVHNSTEIHILTPCPVCGHHRVSAIPLSGPHYAALRCGKCDKFIRWAPKPENQDLQRETAQTINRLLSSEKISSWESFFLRSISQQKKLSPKQREILNQIEAKVGGAAQC